ncbi:MAG: MerR family transcriptional regulator [Nitrospira sp.]|nr:MerR family transcriptional regulator [Nitrospira sp.]
MHKSASLKPYNPLPDKLFYKIGEVSRIVEVEPYVLRYWETEFPFLKPRKNKSGQRVYIKRDVELLLQIKRLLYHERFTIEGVRKRLGVSSLNTAETKAESEVQKAEIHHSSRVTEHVKKRLREILGQLQ